MNPVINNVANMLVNKGQNALTEIISHAADDGISKVKDFIEDKTGIPLTDADGNITNLSDEELTTINSTVNEHRVELERVINELAQAHLDDTQDARLKHDKAMDRYVEVLTEQGEDVANRLWFSANFIYIFSLIITFQIFAFLFFAVFGPVETDKMRFVDITIGNLFGVLNIIVGFFFGNAWAQSRNKTRSTDLQAKFRQARDTFK